VPAAAVEAREEVLAAIMEAGELARAVAEEAMGREREG
jgi:hypothetical protein